MTAGVVGVLAEALAQHQFGEWWEVSKPDGKRVSCSCEWVHESDGLFSWEAEKDARAIHREHVAAVVAALPNIAIVPNEGTTRRYSAAYRNFDGDIVPVGVAYSKRAWAEEVRIEWQRDEPNSKYFIVYRDVPAWQEVEQ